MAISTHRTMFLCFIAWPMVRRSPAACGFFSGSLMKIQIRTANTSPGRPAR